MPLCLPSNVKRERMLTLVLALVVASTVLHDAPLAVPGGGPQRGVHDRQRRHPQAVQGGGPVCAVCPQCTSGVCFSNAELS
jgi:hypothetical protein